MLLTKSATTMVVSLCVWSSDVIVLPREYLEQWPQSGGSSFVDNPLQQQLGNFLNVQRTIA
jgi:hypothetical protein